MSRQSIVGLILHDEDFDGATKVYTAPVPPGGTPPEMFHADRECPHLSRSEHATAWPLSRVVTEEQPPYETCDYCTLSMAATIDLAVEQDDVLPSEVARSIQSTVNETPKDAASGEC